MKQKNMIEEGTRFNRLVVKTHINGKGYLCVCDCGNEKIVKVGRSLKIGRTKSCGCWNKEKNSKLKLPDNQAAKNRIYKNYKAAAKKRGYLFELTVDEFSELIVQPCYYCGLEHSLIEKELAHNGVDRVDNSIGYINTNCVSCCKICNNAKASMSKDEWFVWLKRLFNYQVTSNDYSERK